MCEQVMDKQLSRGIKLFARQIGTCLLYFLGFDDFMRRLASRLAFPFSFGFVRAMGGYLKYPDAPGTKEVMENFSGNLRS